MKQDKNGFIRLKDMEGFDKFVSIFKKMSVTTPEDPNDCLYKDYSVTMTSLKYGEFDFAPICGAEMFIKRVKKLFPTGWMTISSKENGKRNNKIVYVYDFGYTNLHKVNFQTIAVRYYDIDTFGVIFINVDDLKNYAFHQLFKDEEKTLLDYKKILYAKPTPIYRLMELKQEYKDNYKLYLSDCEKYGFKPIDKRFLKRIELTTRDGMPTTFTPDGLFGYLGDDDQEIVNNEN